MRASSRWVHSSWFVLLVTAVAGMSLYFTRDSGYAAVRLTTVEKNALVSNLTTNGKVEPVDARELRAVAPGSIASISVKEGDHVKAGQVIMQLDRTEAAAEVARAEAEVQAAESDLKNIESGGSAAENLELENDIAKTKREQEEAMRELGKSERLLAKNAASRAELDAARDRLNKANHDLAYLQSRRGKRFGANDRERAQARVNEARATLQLARHRSSGASISSPVKGVVFALPVQRGNFVNRGDLLAKVADLGKLHLRV